METYTIKFIETYINENHKNEEILQRVILIIYCYLKYIIQHFDNGYGNFGTSIGISIPVEILERNLPNNSKFIKIINDFKENDDFHFEFLVFTLGNLLRSKDPRDKTRFHDFIDKDKDIHHIYSSFILLRDIHEKTYNNITFIDAVIMLLSDNKYSYCETYNLSEKEYFIEMFMYLEKCLSDYLSVSSN